MRAAALLECVDVSVNYGGVCAVDRASLAVEPGQLVGLIGPNGAGKTSLVDAISGFVPISTGRVLFDGVDLARSKPHQRARAGLVRTFQSLELFDDLSVRDNLLAASERPPWWRLAGEVAWPRLGRDQLAEIDGALESVGIAELAGRSPGEISQGQRKLVAVARALATHPKLLLLDEPASGLDTDESAELGRRLRTLLDRGTSMLLVDHDMGLVLEVCDHLVVLDFGRVIATGPPSVVRGDRSVIEAYLGESLADTLDRVDGDAT
ncbi:MAG: ABC transporter ATP-binding protein [Actinobacteria bacterium]|nr:ABC transporter ATP-binding protein [Actinomycetota bacterium]